MKHYRWQIKPYKQAQKLIDYLAEELNISRIVAQLLVARNVKTVGKAHKFMNLRQSLEDIYDPFLMKDMRKAVDRICEAIEKKQSVLVYGDYDVDGTTAVSIMHSFLQKLGVSPLQYYIPDRHTEGYGVSMRGIDWAAEHKVNLIITLDCGIKAVKTIAHAKSYGIDVIVCDHHTVDDDLPEAFAILNPKQKDCPYPFKDLSGCGVGFKLIHALCIENKLSLKDNLFCYLDILALSIAADMVPMVDENRILMFYGLWKMATKPNLALKIMLGSAGVFSSSITVSDVVFKLSPRLNAAGRLRDAKTVVKLLSSTTPKEAYEICQEIEEYNRTRKETDKKITTEALIKIEKSDPEHKKSTCVVYAPEWHKGVIGIVASRLVEQHYKPSVVFCGEREIITASARSVEGFDLYNALEKCAHLLINYGGHTCAAGLSLKKENFNEFVETFNSVVAESITPEQLQPNIMVDVEIAAHEISMELLDQLQCLAPFGPNNRRPVFVVRNMPIGEGTRIIGNDASHVRFQFGNLPDDVVGVAFGMAKKWRNLQEAALQQGLDVCFSLEINTFNRKTSLQLDIKDISLPQSFEHNFEFKPIAHCTKKNYKKPKNSYEKKHINHRRSRIYRLSRSS